MSSGWHEELARMRAAIARHQQASTPRALWQLGNTLVPYLLLWYLMLRFQPIAPWLTLALAIAAGALLVRLFIIFHDCGHGSFFGKPWANRLVGLATGFMTFTPFHHWHRAHAIHHGASGHLDRRGVGDIWTLTVDEYAKASRWTRIAYGIARHPVVLFLVAPLVMFVLVQRLPSPGATRRARLSVLWMDLSLLAGVWLFYVQHQFDGAYWARGEGWNPAAAALQGSSYYKLPALLQWLTGNIGFHHIHHLGPGVPNYRLQACHESEPAFRAVRPITLVGSLRCLGLRLWDESAKQLMGFDAPLRPRDCKIEAAPADFKGPRPPRPKRQSPDRCRT